MGINIIRQPTLIIFRPDKDMKNENARNHFMITHEGVTHLVLLHEKSAGQATCKVVDSWGKHKKRIGERFTIPAKTKVIPVEKKLFRYLNNRTKAFFFLRGEPHYMKESDIGRDYYDASGNIDDAIREEILFDPDKAVYMPTAFVLMKFESNK